MISKPQPSEIREASISFNEVYETLKSCEKSNFLQFINLFKIQVTKRDWALWVKNKNKEKLNNEKTKIRYFIQIIFVFSLLALPLLFFTIAGDKIANWVVFITVFFVLFAFVISSKNLIAMLEIEIDKIDIEILTIEEILKCTTTQSEINKFLDAFLKSYESDGRFSAQQTYMPFISLAIAKMFKESSYQLDSDVLF